MPDQVLFINRYDELHMINELADQWGTRRVLCIHGEGGIGKTRLLQEVCKKHRNESHDKSSLIVTDITDFDNHAMHIPSNMGHAIGEMLDKIIFEPYFQILTELREMEDAGIGGKMLARKDEESEQKFAECFNVIGGEKRIVLFMDTTDALKEADILNYLVRIIPRLENMFLLVAGRNADAIKSFLEDRIKEGIRYIKLLPLSPEASKDYLKKKQKMLHISLEPLLAQNLIVIAEGRPILLDLAVEWRLREVPLDWLAKGKPEDMKALSDEEKEKRRKEFESHLVRHIADTRRPTDWLILLMSLIYPLDTELIAKLLEIDEDEAENLFDEARKFVFVKRLPDGRSISLHDEMRRMVTEYIWPEVDPDKERRREYLNREIRLLTRRIDELRKQEKTARKKGKIHAELSESARQMEQRRWSFRKELLDNTPLEDISGIVKTLTELFDETTKIYRFSLRETLIDKMLECIHRLSPEQTDEWYELNSRQVKYLYENGEYKSARYLITEILEKRGIPSDKRLDMLVQSGSLKIEMGDLKEGMSDYIRAREQIGTILKKEGILPDRQIEMLINIGNIEIRLGDLKKGIENFEKAFQMSKENDFKHRLVQSLNARGWAFRNAGDFDRAIEDYREAYLISLDIKDYEQTLLLENNMALLYALKGKHQTALNNCQNALEICKSMGLRREMGMTYGTLGRIHELSDQTENALSFYEKALNIFNSENDIEWISRLRCSRASVYLSQQETDKAENDLKWARDSGLKNLLPRILFFQSKVYRYRNEQNLARKKLDECQSCSQEIGDIFFDYATFSCLIELAWEFGEFHRWREFAKNHEKYSDRKSEMDIRLRGTSLRRIGDLAICNGDYDDALDAYKKGLPLIAEYEALKRYAIEEQLRTSKTSISKFVEKDILSRMGKELEEFWKKNKMLTEKSPETLFTFQRWGW
ncbi:MAG: ATP-binding protein [Desulfobacteraceae bacterium]|nr:ATP-binding protein [Desulfobacteraceae bacterium]